jgi:putative FmdB family regulatory protein
LPTYEYACKSCGEHLEVVQRFTDDALTECPSCQGTLRKVFSPVGITFKGSGFYKTDSRSSSKRSSSSSDDKSSTTKETSSKETTSAKETSTPAASTSTKDSGSSSSS